MNNELLENIVTRFTKKEREKFLWISFRLIVVENCIYKKKTCTAKSLELRLQRIFIKSSYATIYRHHVDRRINHRNETSFPHFYVYYVTFQKINSILKGRGRGEKRIICIKMRTQDTRIYLHKYPWNVRVTVLRVVARATIIRGIRPSVILVGIGSRGEIKSHQEWVRKGGEGER